MKFIINMKGLISVLALFLVAAYAQQSYGQGAINRFVDLLPTENSPREDSAGRGWIAQTPTFRGGELIVIGLDVYRLPCRGRTFSVEERDTAPFEVYFFKINGEPIYTFNTQCRWISSLDDPASGDYRSSVLIQGNDALESWLENPATDPIHAEVYLENPMSDPPTSTLVLEGRLE